ncbi:hypothetical protein HYD_3400 [Candidatus Hydrogenosomobacter endosymbioticus]|uniref:Uncharacterized protein n=1 Tax=Candidatus Hydrogenosomobacter endosymbioticus TaxID=2558174 RepID=A0ABN6L3T7_9PROT|nr:hypothetical protein HYD_3400 [Candidatus Hydrogenosomobacter endosymbioticus]
MESVKLASGMSKKNGRHERREIEAHDTIVSTNPSRCLSCVLSLSLKYAIKPALNIMNIEKVSVNETMDFSDRKNAIKLHIAAQAPTIR